MLLARLISLNTRPVSGLEFSLYPYLLSQSATSARKASRSSTVYMWVTWRNIFRRLRAYEVFGAWRHHDKPCRWICTRHRWTGIWGQSCVRIFMTWGLPSTVKLRGFSPSWIRRRKNSKSWGSELSETLYWPATSTWASASIKAIMLIGRWRNVPSSMKWLNCPSPSTGGGGTWFIW